MNITIGFIGLGLIGGSIAKSLKKADSSIQIIAYNRSRQPLINAHEEGIVDEIAYEIDDKTEGYYVLVDFTSDGEFPKELDRQYRITDGILRTIIIRKDK